MLPQRYAKALILAGKEENKLEIVYGDIKKLRQIISSEPVKFLLKSPLYSKRRKIEFVDSLAKDFKFSTIVANFLKLVVKKGRENILEEILIYADLYYHSEIGVEKITLYTADDLGAQKLEEIRSKIEEVLGKKVELEVESDYELLAGFRLVAKDWMISASAYDYIEKFKRLNIEHLPRF